MLQIVNIATGENSIASTMCSSPRWSKPGSRVLDVGCGDGEPCCSSWPERKVDRRPRRRALARQRQRVRGARTVRHPGRRRPRPRRLSRPGVRLRDPEPRPSRRRASPRRCWKTCCASAGARSCRFRTSATGACAPELLLYGPHAVRRRICPKPGTRAPNAHLCTIRDFADLVRSRRCATSSKRSRSTRRASGCRSSTRSRCRTCWARRPCSC